MLHPQQHDEFEKVRILRYFLLRNVLDDLHLS